MGRLASPLAPSLRLAAVAALAVAVYWSAVGQMSFVVRQKADTGTLVKLPLFVDVALAGGDKYFAANIGTVRAMVASVEPNADSEAGLRVLAAIQKDVSRLNPGHEDNYYVAAGNLVGTRLQADGQWILRRAIDARPFDFLPPFFYAVNRMHYDKNPVDGARWLQVAAARSGEEENRVALEKTAARWLLKGEDPEMVAATLELMAQQARTRSLRQHFEKRAQQARALFELQQAIDRYAERFEHRPENLEQLVTAGVLKRLPDDPFGNGYEMNGNGKAKVKSRPARARR